MQCFHRGLRSMMARSFSRVFVSADLACLFPWLDYNGTHLLNLFINSNWTSDPNPTCLRLKHNLLMGRVHIFVASVSAFPLKIRYYALSRFPIPISTLGPVGDIICKKAQGRHRCHPRSSLRGSSNSIISGLWDSPSDGQSLSRPSLCRWQVARDVLSSNRHIDPSYSYLKESPSKCQIL